MGSRIIRLSDDLVSKIAAGEVIERPASCIKELVENSIDAQAQKIICEIKGNGVQEIRVSDDGIGMTISELELAVKSHTTSKLKDEEGLYKITNFGFRGEALPSICRVAEVEISSRPKDQEVGGYIKVKDEQIVENREGPRAIGTTVRVRNLFYNMPARRKFLKSSATELRYITQVIHRLALAYSNISFILTHDDHEILNLLPYSEGRGELLPSLAQRISELLGTQFLDTLTYVEKENSGIRVWGYLSKPYNILATPNHFIFINRRPCRERIVKSAIEHAYGVPLREKSPSYIFFVDIPPELVDVNVHPRKEEVRFRDESLIYNIILKSIRDELGIKAPIIRGQKKRDEFSLEGADFWQFYDSYIFVGTGDGILILDQHAAHERVMYEHIKREKVVRQKLLFPVLVELTEVEQKLLYEFKPSFEELGFGVEEFGEGTYRITSVPSILKDFTPELFKTMLLELAEYNRVSEDKMQKTIKLLACKSAIKSGNKLAPEEVRALTNSLFATDNPYFCPHGRPTIIKLTKSELEHKFGK